MNKVDMSRDILSFYSDGFDSIHRLIKNDNTLYKAVKSESKRLDVCNRDLIFAILSLKYPNSDHDRCTSCGKDMQFRESSGGGGELRPTCCNSCDLIRRHKDPDYTSNIKRKAMSTREVSISEGKYDKGAASRKAYMTRRGIYDKDQIAQQILGYGKRLPKDEARLLRESSYSDRIDRCLYKLGKHRFLRLLYIARYNDKRYDLFLNMLDTLVDHLTIENPVEFFLTNILRKDTHKVCKNCGDEFRSHTLIGRSVHIRPSEFCDRACAKRYSFDNDPESRSLISRGLLKYYAEHPEYRLVISNNSKRMWSGWGHSDRKANRIRATDTMRNDVIDGKSGLRRRGEKIRATNIRLGHIVNIKDRVDYDYYRQEVYRITASQPLSTLDDCDKRGKREYHLDHIFPISKAYVFDIPSHMVGDISNLRFIPAKDNQIKTNRIISIPIHIEAFLLESGKLNELMEINNEIEINKIRAI